MEADTYPQDWKDLAYKICDGIRNQGLRPPQDAYYFDEKMKDKFPELSEMQLDHLFSWAMFSSR